MTRVINSNSPAKRRRQFLRTVAEIVHRLAAKNGIDEEARDMLAMMIFSLRGVKETVEETVLPWEKRGYWKKAAAFELEWEWAGETALRLENLLRDERWERLPELMVGMQKFLAGISVNRLTRSPELWRGSYRRLTASPPPGTAEAD